MEGIGLGMDVRIMDLGTPQHAAHAINNLTGLSFRQREIAIREDRELMV